MSEVNNPFQPPQANPEAAGEPRKSDAYLATNSLVFAGLLLMSPCGADLLFTLMMGNERIAVGCICLLFYVIVMVPLWILFRRHGVAAVRLAPGRILLTTFLLAIHAVIHIGFVLR